MSELQNIARERYMTMSEFLIEILPNDIIKYVIKDYIYDFLGVASQENPVPLVHNIEIFAGEDYEPIIVLNENEFVVYDIEGETSHYMINEYNIHTQKMIGGGKVAIFVLKNRTIIAVERLTGVSIYDVNTYKEISIINH